MKVFLLLIALLLLCSRAHSQNVPTDECTREQDSSNNWVCSEPDAPCQIGLGNSEQRGKCGIVRDTCECLELCPSAQVPCFIGTAECCDNGEWACPDGVTGESGCSAPCCNPFEEPGQFDNPWCFEGHTCCGNGEWACNDGSGGLSCEGVAQICDVCDGCTLSRAPLIECELGIGWEGPSGECALHYGTGECYEPWLRCQCGGIAGQPCRAGQVCVDIPDDACDPDTIPSGDPRNGGVHVDCPGECIDIDEAFPLENCDLPKDVGPCDALFPRFYYDSTTGACESFNYGGCQGNVNNFEIEEDCTRFCECRQDADVGPCDGAVNKWTYNAQTHRCEEFTWGGCGGNDNKFDTSKACTKTCGGVL